MRESHGRRWALAIASVALLAGCRLGSERQRTCTESTETGFCRPERVSIERLIAQASAYDGRRVRVRGFAHVAAENSGLYPSQEDSAEWRSKRGLWLDVPTGRADPVDHLVEVEGTFDRANQGFQGNWSGAITHVFSLKKIDEVTR